MAARQATITVDARLAEAYNQAPAAQRKEILQTIKHMLLGATKTKAPRLSKKETELFLIINHGLPADQQKRIDELTEKMEFESITDAEHAELLRLIEAMEMAQVKRLKAVAELAKVRNVSLSEMMRQLGLEPGRYAR
jgi:Arc/MetJ-type ribon-helix-helix transcriptional regulator